MITPAFELTQDTDFLIISIRVPYAKFSEFDLYIEGDDFKFYSKPYFLRLNLPGRIVEDGRQKGTYNADTGTFTVQVPKEIPGQHFEGLNLLTSLLAPKGKRSSKPLIDEIGSTDASHDDDEDEDEFDWQIDQTPYEEPTDDILYSLCTYGFGNLRTGVFKRLQEEMNEIIDLRDPDITPASERTKRRLAAETDKFNPDHYLADLFEDDAIQHLLKYQPWWEKILAETSTLTIDSQEKRVTFNEKEKEQLRKLTNKSHLLDKKTQHLAYLGLIDILLAYCYEARVTEGERNVESAWNIRKLSGTLSWFENYKSIKDVLVSFGRRVLCYPLYRHFALVTKAIEDTISVLKIGKASALKCLLDIHSIFQENDPAYVLNELYVTDYCIWIQRVKSKKVSSLCECLQAVSISKADMGFELEELEEAGRLVQEEEQQNPASATLPSVPRQQPAVILSEISSCSASESEDSASEEEKPTSDGDLRLQGSPIVPQREKAALLIEEFSTEDATTGKYNEPLKATLANLEIEKSLEDKMRTAVILSGSPSGQDASTDGPQGDKVPECSMQLADTSTANTSSREYLEVTPRRNMLFIVPPSDEDALLVENV